MALAFLLTQGKKHLSLETRTKQTHPPRVLISGLGLKSRGGRRQCGMDASFSTLARKDSIVACAGAGCMEKQLNAVCDVMLQASPFAIEE